jgi:hypothetical protein
VCSIYSITSLFISTNQQQYKAAGGIYQYKRNPTRDNHTRNSNPQATQRKTDSNNTSKPETTIPVQLIKEREREGRAQMTAVSHLAALVL